MSTSKTARAAPKLILTRRSLIGALMVGACRQREEPEETPAFPGADLRDIKGQEIYSESVYADAISADGQNGFVCRIGRYPSIDISWAWVHVFDNGKVFAFTDHRLPCDAERTDLAAGHVAYVVERADTRLRLERAGPREAPRECNVVAASRGHRSEHAEHGQGRIPLVIEASFRPAHEPVSSLSGRTEVLGHMSGMLEIADESHSVDWRGHFHEQVRSTPRWMAPFCYATLRGDDYHSVAIKLGQGAVGFVVRADAAARVTGFDIEPPAGVGGGRRFALHLETGERIEGTYLETHVYSIPIYEVRRRGSVVGGEAGGVQVSGCINDYLPERLSYLA